MVNRLWCSPTCQGTRCWCVMSIQLCSSHLRSGFGVRMSTERFMPTSLHSRFCFTSRLGYRLNRFTYQRRIIHLSISSWHRSVRRLSSKVEMTMLLYYQWKTTITWSLSGKHDFALMAGMEFAKNHFEIINASANGLTSTMKTSAISTTTMLR